jgi:hypothetical protein
VSYDLYMLTPEPGVHPGDLLERLDGAGPPDPEALERQRRIAAALRAADPRLEQNDYELEGTPGIQLIADDGIDISLSPAYASISFPYWESLDAARLIEDIDRAAKIITAETGWQLYDPQLDRFIDPQHDAAAFTEAFRAGVGYVQGAAPGQTPERPSLWRRLFGGGS